MFKGFCDPVIDAEEIGPLHSVPRHTMDGQCTERTNTVKEMHSQESASLCQVFQEKPLCDQPYPNPTLVNRLNKLRR